MCKGANSRHRDGEIGRKQTKKAQRQACVHGLLSSQHGGWWWWWRGGGRLDLTHRVWRRRHRRDSSHCLTPPQMAAHGATASWTPPALASLQLLSGAVSRPLHTGGVGVAPCTTSQWPLHCSVHLPSKGWAANMPYCARKWHFPAVADGPTRRRVHSQQKPSLRRPQADLCQNSSTTTTVRYF